jgi:hypothetical protein
MEFLNESGIEARLFAGSLSETSNGGWVVVRQTLRLKGADASIVPAEERWPIFTAPLKTEFGVFPPDDFPLRNKAELVVVASVTSRRPTRAMVATLRAADFTTRLSVFGTRRWVKSGKNLVPGEPEPFTEMDLGLKNAFGGTIEYGGEKMPHPLNPHGRGFYSSSTAAEHGLLPNVEHPDWLVRAWNDQPVIGTWGPVPDGVTWQMATWLQERNRARSRSGAEDEDEDSVRAAIQKQVLNTFPTAAPPGLLLDRLNPGDSITLDLGEQRIQFVVPTIPLDVRVQVGGHAFNRTPAPIAVWMFVPKGLIVVTWMARFRYSLRRGDVRQAVLRGV